MGKVFDNPITLETDWGGDASTGNLPVSGRRVQELIKKTFTKKGGCVQIKDKKFLQIFADEASMKKYNFDKKYESTEGSSMKKIYIAFAQEPWYRILEGSLGFTGDILTDAYSYYNSYVSKERRAISRELKRIFDNWCFNANPSNDYEIQPLSFINANNSNK